MKHSTPASRRAASRQFTQDLKHNRFCVAGRRWARGKTLAQAWKTCQRGEYMSFWIGIYANFGRPTRKHLIELRLSVETPELCLGGYAEHFSTPRLSREFADLMRATYNYDGTRKD